MRSQTPETKTIHRQILSPPKNGERRRNLQTPPKKRNNNEKVRAIKLMSGNMGWILPTGRANTNFKATMNRNNQKGVTDAATVPSIFVETNMRENMAH